MPLVSCKLCGRAFVSDRNKVCYDCMRRLEEIYAKAHEYLRDNCDENFDVIETAEALGVSSLDIQMLVELGYFERDFQTYGRKDKTRRQMLAKMFEEELQKMKNNDITTYGGIVYDRRSELEKEKLEREKERERERERNKKQEGYRTSFRTRRRFY